MLVRGSTREAKIVWKSSFFNANVLYNRIKLLKDIKLNSIYRLTVKKSDLVTSRVEKSLQKVSWNYSWLKIQSRKSRNRIFCVNTIFFSQIFDNIFNIFIVSRQKVNLFIQKIYCSITIFYISGLSLGMPDQSYWKFKVKSVISLGTKSKAIQ